MPPLMSVFESLSYSTILSPAGALASHGFTWASLGRCCAAFEPPGASFRGIAHAYFVAANAIDSGAAAASAARGTSALVRVMTVETQRSARGRLCRRESPARRAVARASILEPHQQRISKHSDQDNDLTIAEALLSWELAESSSFSPVPQTR